MLARTYVAFDHRLVLCPDDQIVTGAQQRPMLQAEQPAVHSLRDLYQSARWTSTAGTPQGPVLTHDHVKHMYKHPVVQGALCKAAQHVTPTPHAVQAIVQIRPVSIHDLCNFLMSSCPKSASLAAPRNLWALIASPHPHSCQTSRITGLAGAAVHAQLTPLRA
jgi:hypothetical protein